MKHAISLFNYSLKNEFIFILTKVNMKYMSYHLVFNTNKNIFCKLHLLNEIY